MAQKGLTVGRAGSHVGNDQVGGVYRSGSTVVELSAGSFNVTAYVLAGTIHRFPLGVGSFTLTGYDIEVSGTQTIAVDAGVFTVTGHALGILQRIPLSAGAFALTGNDVGVKQIIPLSTGSYAVTGNDLGIKQIIPLGVGEFLTTGYDIDVILGAAPATTSSRGLRFPEKEEREEYQWELLRSRAVVTAIMAAAEEEDRRHGIYA